MLILDSTQKLEIVLSGAITANQCPIFTSWSDDDGTTLTSGSTASTTNSTTAVTIMAAPAVGTLRQLKALFVYNADTAAVTATIRINISATLYILHKVILAIGYTLSIKGDQWVVTRTDGSIAGAGVVTTFTSLTDVPPSYSSFANEFVVVNAVETGLTFLAATTANIPDSTDRRYVTDAEEAIIDNTSGVNTGDQTITLTGDVTGSGTGSFATTLAASGVAAATYGDSTHVPFITFDAKGRATSASSNTVTHTLISDFDTQVRTSTLNQMAAPTADLSINSHKLTSVSDPSNPQDAVTLQFLQNWAGTSNITTLGTITTGTWTGTTIALANGGTGQTTANAAFDALTIRGTDITAAATTNIGAGTGVYIKILGTTTITAFDTVPAGVIRFLRFAAALTITYNASTLLLPGAANITTATNDTAIFVSLGSGVWFCADFTRAATPPPSGTNTGDQTITLTSDVTGSGTGSFATTIAAGAVTLAKQANLAANSIQGNNTGSPATPIALTVAQTNSLLQGDGLTSGQAGSRNLYFNSQSAAYTTVAADSGAVIFHPAADTSARTWTIDSNTNVPYPNGTTITFDNDIGAGIITISITADTLVLVGAVGSTGNRTLAAGGQATAIKVAATRWRISGIGLS